MEADAESKTVVAKSQSLDQDQQDLCHMYFGNERRSGGGDIEEEGVVWNEEQRCFFITFVDSRVARRVASREHTINNSPVQVQLWSPPSSSGVAVQEDRVLISGVHPATTPDCLQNYIECVLDVDVASVLMNREDNTAVVMFESPPKSIDVEGMEHACQDNPLDPGRSLSFHGVPVSSTMAPAVCSIVRVTGLGPETANQAVQYFFSNKRRNFGGPVKRVVKDPGSSTALVHFENPADAESVVNKGSHVLDGRSLCVSLHEASHSGDRTAFRESPVGYQHQAGHVPVNSAIINSYSNQPKDKYDRQGRGSLSPNGKGPQASEPYRGVEHSSHNPPKPGFKPEFRPPPRTVRMELGTDVIQEIINDNTLLTKMIQEISSVQSRLKWELPDHIVITCQLQDPGQNWESHVDEMMNRFVRPIRLQLQRERECAGQEAADNPERTSWSNTNSPSANDTPSSVNSPVGSARDTQKPPSLGNMEDIIPNLKPAQIKILRLPKTMEKLKRDHPGLEISVDEDQKIATVKASETSMKKAYTDVLAFVTNVREMKIPLSPAMALMFKKKDAEDWIQKTLVERYDLLCHWEESDDHIILSGQNFDLSRQEQLLKSVFTEFSCSITEKDACLLKSPAWTSFLERMQEMDRGGCPTPVLLPEETQIIIVDTPSNLSQTRLALTKFLEENKPEKGGAALAIAKAVEDLTPPCTVILRGCDLDMEETYHLYFDNPKTGGGDIADVVVDTEQQAILITFEDPEVAERVVAQQHRVGGRDLDVSLYTPKKVSAKRQKSQEPSAEEEEAVAPRRTVVVSIGQGQLQSKDMYILYFESHRCGGGDVEGIDFDQEKRLVYVTFVDPAVAERVAGRQHKIAGGSAEVWLYVPPKPQPTYPNKLLFQNKADTTTHDCLIMHLERISGMEPEEIVYGDEVGTVLVTFPKEPDFNGIHQMSQKRMLEKRYLTVSKVPISNCLLVENLCDRTTEDTVRLYFENYKRSRGGNVEKVEMVPKENKCFVYFESHEVLDGVLGQRHSLDGQALPLKRYLQCLGQSGGSEDPTAFTMPKTLVLDTLDPFKVAFLRQSKSTQPDMLQQFLQQLSSNHAQGMFEKNSLIVECALTPAVPRARILAHTWRVDVEGSVSGFLDLLQVKKRPVVQQLWTEVEPAVREADRGSPGGATLFPVPEESTLVVVGMKSMAQELYNKVDAIVKAKEEMERRKQEVTETNSKQSESKLSLLLAIGFHLEAGKRHEGLKVVIQTQNKTIVFHGMLKDVKEAQVEMYELLSTMKSGKIPDMTDIQRKVLFTKGTKNHIVQKFKSQNISAVWEQGQQSEVNVHAFDDKSLANAIHLIKVCVPEHVLHLSPESSELLHSLDWKNLVAQLTKTYPSVVLLIAPSHDSLQIFVTCIDTIMHPVVEEIERFMAENTIYSQSVCFSPSRQKLVHMKWLGKLDTLAQNLRAFKVQITNTRSGDKIIIKGTSKGLQEVMKQLEDINQKIVYHEAIFEDPRQVKLLTSDCDNDLKMIGRSSQCVLSLQPEDAQLQVFQQAQSGVGQSSPGAQWYRGGGGGTGAHQNRKLSDDASSQAPSPGGVASALRKKCGPQLVQECRRQASTGGSAVQMKQTVTASSNPVMEKVSLYVYAEKQSDVDEALKALENISKERFLRSEIQDEVICSFDAKDVERVMQIGQKHKAELKIQTMTGCITCDGLHKQVYDCMTEINGYIRSVYQNQKEREAAFLMADMISWCFLEVTLKGTMQREYQPKENHIIETAYREKKTQAKIQDADGNVYVIDFNSMKEFAMKDHNDTVDVVRKDKIKDMAGGRVPDFWEPQGANETVKLVALKNVDPEYQTVANNFNASVGNVTILNIERVQNPHLYHQYIAKKAHLEKQNPGIENEKILWHGTSADAITNINHHGFNRSYCGKNATVLGNGVYFARYSASTTYSPPDASGKRCVYQCKVLVGHPTTGHPNLRVLPARQGPILYDSATDYPNVPSMYVIFSDTQAYPQYMLTFQ